MDGVVKVSPVPKIDPPLTAEYQRMVTAEVAETVTVPGPHLELSIVTGSGGCVAIVA